MRHFPRPQPSPEALSYLGKTIRLHVSEREVPRIGKVKVYNLDDLEMEAALMALGPQVVICPPGYGSTMDHVPYRLNFSVDEAGVITKVYMG